MQENRKQKKAENELLKKLQRVPIIDMLLEDIQSSAEKNEVWLQKSQSTYDSCERLVVIQKERLQIFWQTQKNEKSNRKQIVESLCCDFSKKGYMPLEAYQAANGTIVPVEKVCCLVASVICLKLREKFRDCQFPSNINESRFTYTVPGTEGCAWF